MDGVALGTVQRDPRTNAFDGRAIRRTFDEVPCCLCISSCVFRVHADLEEPGRLTTPTTTREAQEYAA